MNCEIDCMDCMPMDNEEYLKAPEAIKQLEHQKSLCRIKKQCKQTPA